MSIIHLLTPEIADAIAAGEVIERPASVVKELVENSLDANARRITIDVRGAGKISIRVSDDGDGISAEDLQMAFVRHATSKVTHLSDLDAIVSPHDPLLPMPGIRRISAVCRPRLRQPAGASRPPR